MKLDPFSVSLNSSKRSLGRDSGFAGAIEDTEGWRERGGFREVEPTGVEAGEVSAAHSVVALAVVGSMGSGNKGAVFASGLIGGYGCGKVWAGIGNRKASLQQSTDHGPAVRP